MGYLELLNRFYDLLQRSQVSNNAQLLYYTLLQIDNKCSWSDWFSRTNISLCGMMGISENAMKRSRAELKQMGLIDFKPSKRRGESTQYHICGLGEEGKKDEGKEIKPSFCTVQTDTQMDTQTDTESEEPSFCTVQMDTQSDTQTDTKPDTQSDSINRQRQKPRQRQKQKKDIADAAQETCVQNPRLDAAVKEFVDYRKKIRKPMTSRAVTMLLNRLEELAPGDDAAKIAILDQSVFHSWTGVFPLKEDRGSGRDGQGSSGNEERGSGSSNNRFHNFPPSATSYDALMQQKLKARMEADGE